MSLKLSAAVIICHNLDGITFSQASGYHSINAL